MLFKTALKNLKKSPIMNLICLIQLTAVFLIAAVMISTMSVRYQTYASMKYLLNERGIYTDYMMSFGALKPGGDPNTDAIFSVDELCEYIGAQRASVIRRQPMIAADNDTAMANFYDDEMIRHWNPGIKRGRWLSTDADELEIVIPDGAFGLDVGDEAEVWLFQYHQEGPKVKVKVVGVLEDDAKILGWLSNREISGDTYRFLYSSLADLDQNFIASYSVVNKLYPKAYELCITNAFFFYDDATDEELKDAMKTSANMNGLLSLSLEDVNENSKEYLRAELMKLLPIVVILLILTLVSSISTSAISARRRLKDYARYYVIGLRWNQCAVVNLLQALTTGTAALVITVAGLIVISFTALSETFMIIWNAPMVLTLLGLLAVYLVFSMIMPLIMLKSVTPKALLQSE